MERNINFKLPEELIAELAAYATASGRSKKHILVAAVKEYLQEKKHDTK